MVPEKPEVAQARETAARLLQDFLTSPGTDVMPSLLESISLIKGLYSQSWKHDRTDWFLSWERLGPLPASTLKEAAHRLSLLRAALKGEDHWAIDDAIERCLDLGIADHLARYLANRNPFPGTSIYILSKERRSEILTIGATAKDPYLRVRELARPYREMAPLGVRAAWHVKGTDISEASLDALLASYRHGSERSTFQLALPEAIRIIEDVLSAHDPSTWSSRVCGSQS